jgi:hypothetical protein
MSGRNSSEQRVILSACSWPSPLEYGFSPAITPTPPCHPLGEEEGGHGHVPPLKRLFSRSVQTLPGDAAFWLQRGAGPLPPPAGAAQRQAQAGKGQVEGSGTVLVVGPETTFTCASALMLPKMFAVDGPVWCLWRAHLHRRRLTRWNGGRGAHLICQH